MRGTTRRSFLVLLTIVLAAGCSNAPTPAATSRSPAPSPSVSAASITGPTSPTATPIPPTALQLGDTQPLVALSLQPTSAMADNGVGGPMIAPGVDPASLLVGFRWTRTCMDWGRVEQTPGHYTIEAGYEKGFTDLATRGVSVVLSICDGEPRLDQSHFANEAAIERYGDYVRYLVRHFKGRIGYYELWNEPNGGEPPHHDIALADYVNMVSQVVPIIRAEDPEAKIVVPAASGPWAPGYPGYGSADRYVLDTDYLYGVLDTVGSLVDGISWHPFYGDRADDPYYQGYPDLVREIKARADRDGFHGVYIAEEMAWATPEYPILNQPLETPEAEDAYLLRTVVTHRGLDVIAIPSCCADFDMVRNTNVLLAGATPTDLPVHVETAATHVRTYAFTYPDGSRLVALWNDWLPVDHNPGVASTMTIEGLAGASVTAYDAIDGHSQQLVTSASGSALVIKNLLVKDYPTFLRIGG